ncbi:hypothetical protein Tco_0420931 [Tanacetum coccineum]
MNGISVDTRIANQHGIGNVVTARAEGNSNGSNDNQIRCVNGYEEGHHHASTCTVKPKKLDVAYLQKQIQIAQKEEVGIQLTQEEFDFMVDACATYTDMQTKIERLQALLGDLKGKSSNTQCASNTLDPVSQKLEDEKVSLEFQVQNYAKENEHLKTTFRNLLDSITLRAQLFDKVSEQKDTTKGTRTNTKFTKQSILGKPPSSSKPKLYSLTPFPKFMVLPKKDESNALLKPVNSNSAPPLRESKVVQTVKVESKGSLASSRTRKPRTYLRWLPTGRTFDLYGYISSSRNTEGGKTRVPSEIIQEWLMYNSVHNSVFKEKGSSWKVYSVISLMKYSNGENQVVLMSSAVTTADAFDKCQ